MFIAIIIILIIIVIISSTVYYYALPKTALQSSTNVSQLVGSPSGQSAGQAAITYVLSNETKLAVTEASSASSILSSLNAKPTTQLNEVQLAAHKLSVESAETVLIDNYEKAFSKLTNENNVLNNNMISVQTQYNGLLSEKKTLDDTLASITHQYNALVGEKKSIDEVLASKTSQYNALVGEKNTTEKKLDDKTSQYDNLVTAKQITDRELASKTQQYDNLVGEKKSIDDALATKTSQYTELVTAQNTLKDYYKKLVNDYKTSCDKDSSRDSKFTLLCEMNADMNKNTDDGVFGRSNSDYLQFINKLKPFTLTQADRTAISGYTTQELYRNNYIYWRSGNNTNDNRGHGSYYNWKMGKLLGNDAKANMYRSIDNINKALQGLYYYSDNNQNLHTLWGNKLTLNVSDGLKALPKSSSETASTIKYYNVKCLGDRYYTNILRTTGFYDNSSFVYKYTDATDGTYPTDIYSATDEYCNKTAVRFPLRLYDVRAGTHYVPDDVDENNDPFKYNESHRVTVV